MFFVRVFSFVLKKRVLMNLRACSGSTEKLRKQEFAISDVIADDQRFEEEKKEKSNQSLKLIKWRINYF